MKPPFPPNERARLAALASYGILDTPPESVFDDLTSFAAALCRTPIAMVSLVDESRQWFKSKVGNGTTETAREISFCGHTICGHDMLLVPDALADERFADNPLVVGDPGVRFYAGVPLIARGGEALGAICVMDRTPRSLDASQIEGLRVLGQQVMGQIELRQQIRERKLIEQRFAVLSEHAEVERKALFDLSSDLFCVCDLDGWLEQVNSAWTTCLEWSVEESTGRPWLDFVHPEDREATRRAVEETQRGLTATGLKNRLKCKDGSFRWLSWRLTQVAETRRVLAAARDITGRKRNEVALFRMNRAVQLFSRGNETMTRSEAECGLLESVCRCAIDIGGFGLAWVGYALDDETKTIEVQAQSGAGDPSLPESAMTWSDADPAGQSAAGRAIRCGEPVLVPDLESGEYVRPWLEFEREHGFCGMLCFPMKDHTRTIGVLVGYLSEIRQLEDDELQMLRDLADDVAFGIGSRRANIERCMTHDAVLSMARGISGSTGNEFFERLVLGAVEALGAHVGVIARINPDETRASTLCAVVDGSLISNFEYALAGTPCEHLKRNDIWIVPESAASLYPECRLLVTNGAAAYVGAKLLDAAGESIGLMFLLFRQTQAWPDFISSTLKIFGARAAGELARLKSDALLREQAALLDKAQDAILVHDFEHRISFWNRSAERLYGWSAAEVVGCLARDLIYHDPSALAVAVETTMAKGEWVGEFVQITKDGSHLTVEARWTLLLDEQGGPKSILSINTDITERKKLEQQFLRAQRMESIGTLAGGIAHDINNVLSPIMMSIDLLRMYVSDPDGVNILNLVGASARRGAEMVRQVLSFARGVEGRAEEVEVSHVVEDLLRIIEETFPKNIRLEARLQPDLWLIKGDPTQIHQVLLNLCVNARDAMPEGGRITLKVQNMMIDECQVATNLEAHPGPYLAIEIEDTGHGIPKEIIEKIFDPFFTTKEMGKGTGLGLSTTLAIMKSHGGFISAHSSPGAGARFRIYLPAMTELGWASVDTPDTELPRGEGETVMVVDDEVFVRQITSQTLESFGYKVLLAANGSEAISTYVEHQNEISVVITDMMMPVMDGPATIRTLRRLNPFVRIIGASGINAKSNVARASNAGANCFLPKPYTAETLLKTLRAMLKDSA